MSENQSPKFSESNDIMVLPFCVQTGMDNLEFFLNIHKVLKVFEARDLTALPAGAKSGAFHYLYDFQGLSVPVLHLGAWLQQFEQGEDAAAQQHQSVVEGHGRMLICQVMDYIVGVVVDQTRKVRRVKNDAIAFPPELMEQSFPFISAVLKQDRHYSFMLDLEYFLQASGIDLTGGETAISDQIDLSQLRVLIVEDSRFFRQLAYRVFEKYGSKVIMAENGQAGLAKLREQEFDLVISDIEMPMMNGIEMIRKFIAENPDHKSSIVFHSSISNAALMRDIQKEGLGLWLSKFDESALIDLVASILSEKSKRSQVA